MAVVIECPQCRRRGRLNPVALPASVTCPGCGAVWQVAAPVPDSPTIDLGVRTGPPRPVCRSRRAAWLWGGAALAVGLTTAGLVVAAFQGRLSGALPFPVPLTTLALTAEQKAVRKHILDESVDPTAIRFERWFPVIDPPPHQPNDPVVYLYSGYSVMFAWGQKPGDRWVRVIYHRKAALVGELRREVIYLVRNGAVEEYNVPRPTSCFITLRERYYGDED